ncbi:MAG: acylneuraminate cytidylyltransferase family protein [Roseburia sp.]|jgi:CMP-N-acetylneuraminic acid synthetase|nr:acylneuraminate cytidylyltransferase family protein [Roseburia sp.]
MKTAALIPIKLGSQRVPGKNTKPFFDGKPLMSFIQKACLDAVNINEVYIYCSDDAVIPYVLPGVKYLKRPKYLDGDAINANDFIREFMNSVDADIYVNAHTTSPFAKPETLDELVEKVASGEYDSAFCAETIRTFMWEDGKPVNFDPDHFPRTQDLPLIYGETSIAYVFTRESFIKHNRRLGTHPYIKEVGKIEAIDIDYPEDFEIANAIYKEIIRKR